MSSTTKKFREFMAEPIGEKDIREVPGIGDVLGKKLCEAGYEKVSQKYFLTIISSSFFFQRLTHYSVNFFCVIKMLNNFKNGSKLSVAPIAIKQNQQHRLFLTGQKHSSSMKKERFCFLFR